MSTLSDPTLIRTAAFIDGQWLSAAETYPVVNPSNGAVITEVPRCDDEMVTRAIAAAHRAFSVWRATTARHRSELLRRWYELIVAHRSDLGRIITLEEGKPLTEALGEVDYASSFVQWFSEEAKRVYGDVIPAPRDRTNIVVMKEPIGVCAAITPWNFPAAMITRKVAPALAAGCTMIVKPASQTPLTALALADLSQRAGIPAGVFNVVTGAPQDARRIGASLTDSNEVRKLTFTGSTEIGRQLLRQAAATVKRVSMELGGNAPFIVFDDANVDAAVEQLLIAKYRNSGQSCIGANRVLVHTSIYDQFAEKFALRSRALHVGDGLAPNTQIGPLINEAAVRKVEEHIADAVAGGARLICGGQRHALGGSFFEPTVLTDVHSGMRIATEETFGPVTPLFRFAQDDEAIALANATEYGLAAYLFSESAARIWAVSSRIESGMVGINCGLISNEVAPFGGIKQSGLGREGSYMGIEEFLETKYLCWSTATWTS